MAKINFNKFNNNLSALKSHSGFLINGLTFYNTGSGKGYVTCPCCLDITEIFVWSFAGCGKRCWHCNVLLMHHGAYIENSEIPEKEIIRFKNAVLISDIKNIESK
jgi:hypothetical protein